MEPKKSNPNVYTVRYTLKKEDITQFLQDLEVMQHDYLDAAVEASGYKDAKIVLNHIMGLK